MAHGLYAEAGTVSVSTINKKQRFWRCLLFGTYTVLS